MRWKYFFKYVMYYTISYNFIIISKMKIDPSRNVLHATQINKKEKLIWNSKSFARNGFLNFVIYFSEQFLKDIFTWLISA
jgi:hypothetical protein